MRSFFIFATALLYLLFPAGQSVLAQMPSTNPQVPALVDTATVELTMPEGSPICHTFSVIPDSLGFGIPGILVLDFGDQPFDFSATDLKPSAPWLRIDDATNPSENGQVVFELRAYRLNPFRVKIGSAVGEVVSVVGTATDLNETAAIRMPRTWSSRWWVVLLGAALLTALVVVLWWLWSRRRRLEPLQQWLPAQPAWLKFSGDLRTLMQADLQDIQNSRPYLDQLAWITRQYLAGRYLVRAGELTGKEILAACLGKGHDSHSLRKMVRILENLDRHRYDPEAPSVVWCRQQTNDLFQSIAEVRIIPSYCLVEPALLLEAETDWAWLEMQENRSLEIPSGSGGGM